MGQWSRRRRTEFRGYSDELAYRVFYPTQTSHPCATLCHDIISFLNLLIIAVAKHRTINHKYTYNAHKISTMTPIHQLSLGLQFLFKLYIIKFLPVSFMQFYLHHFCESCGLWPQREGSNAWLKLNKGKQQQQQQQQQYAFAYRSTPLSTTHIFSTNLTFPRSTHTRSYSFQIPNQCSPLTD